MARTAENSGPEDDLVSRAVGGDLEALETLLRTDGASICAAVPIDRRWAREFDADDILQITSIEAILRIGSLREGTREGFRSWLASIARNNLRDAIRALETQKRTPPEARITHDGDGRSARTLMAQLEGSGPSASAILRGQEDVDRLHRALSLLPPVYRNVITTVDLDERSVGDVAKELGRSNGAVHLLRVRGRARLRELLSELD